MERVKDFSKMVIKPNDVLAQIKVSNSSIILAGDSEKQKTYDHAVVIKVGDDVKDVVPGDIILDMKGAAGFTVKKNGVEENYALIPRFGINLLVHADNFDNTSKAALKTTKMVN